MELISVIVPVHNSELYIKRCVKSIQNQIYDNLEIILVVNNSKDKSLEYCKNLAEFDKRIKIIHTEKGGVSYARNLGLKKAQGNYITFVDSDDYIDRQMMLNLYNDISNTESDIAICSLKKVNNTDIVEHDSFLKKSLTSFDRNEAIKYFLTNKIKGYSWGKLYKSSLIKNINYNESFRMCEDELFLFDSLQYVSHVCISNREDYFYVQHELSVCNSDFDEDVRWDAVKSKEIILNKVIQNYSKYHEIAKENYICELIRYAILANDSKSSIDILRKKYISCNIRNQIRNIFIIRKSFSWKIYGFLLCINYDLFSTLFRLNKKYYKKSWIGYN